MRNETDITKDGIRYTRVRIAARKAGLVADYVSRMCREGSVRAIRHASMWYVDEESLALFLRDQAAGYEKFKERKSEEGKRLFQKVELAMQQRFTVPPHPQLRAHAAKRTAQKRAALIAGAGVGCVILLASLGFALEGARSATLANAQTDGQLAAVSSGIPFIDSFADAVYRVFCPLFNMCAEEEADTAIVQETPRTIAQPTAPVASPIPPAPQPTPAPQPQPVQQVINQPIIERVVETVRTVFANAPVPSDSQYAQLSARIDGLSRLLEIQIDGIARSMSRGGSGGGGTTVINQGGGGSGTVTSVEASGGTTGLLFSGGPVTTSGTLTLSGTLAVANGGTGTSTAPTYGRMLVGNSSGGYDLVATSSLGIIGAASSPGGLDGAIQFNNAGVFAGEAAFDYDSAADRLTVPFASTTAVSADAVCLGADCRTAWPTSGGADPFPGGATTTQLAFNGGLTATGATTTNLAITSLPNALLATNAFGTVIATTSLSASLIDTSGDWTGTLDGQDGAYYLANGFSTTSADYWKTQNNFFSTTSADYYIAQAGIGGFSTTSADYWKSVNDFFSTSSAQYFVSVTDLFSTTSANFFVASSSTIPKTYAANIFTDFQTFTAGLLSLASTTIGDGTQGGGLTISGGATTTGSLLFLGSAQANGGLHTGSGTVNIFNGQLRMGSGSAANPIIANGAVTNTGIFFTSPGGQGTINFSVNGAERARFAADGNFGLGTTTPWGSLSASSTSAFPTLALQQNGSGLILNTSDAAGASIFTIGQSGATTTNLAISGTASTSLLYGAGLADCAGGNMLTWNNGLFGCEPDDTGGGSVSDFDFASNFGSLNAATTSPLWAQNGINASSTSRFEQINFSANGSAPLATMGTVKFITASSSNTSLGRSALTVLTTGVQNTAIGNGTLDSLVDGSDNTAVGTGAGTAVSSGQQNSFLGTSAGASVTSGTANTIIGKDAISGTVGLTGSNNVALGYDSLYALTGNSSGNLGLGKGAGSSQTGGSNNILIGLDVQAPSLTGSNQLNIGNLLYSRGVGTGGTAATGNLGVGTSSPYSKLTTWGAGSLFEAVNSASSTIFSIGQNGATTTNLYASGNIDIATNNRLTFGGDTDNGIRGASTYLATNALGNVYINIDANNNSTDAIFAVARDNGDSSGSELLRVQEDGLTIVQNLLATASSTIGNGTATGGLTISGTATTTGDIIGLGNMDINNGSGFLRFTSGNSFWTLSQFGSLGMTGAGTNALTYSVGNPTRISGYDDGTAQPVLIQSGETSYGSGNVAIGTTTPYSKLTVWSGGPLFEAVNSASTTVFSIGQGGATTTLLAANTLCLTGDGCITSWPTGGGADPFPSAATSTTLTFSNGLLSLASTTIGNGTAAGGLTISGDATTTGNASFLGDLNIGSTVGAGDPRLVVTSNSAAGGGGYIARFDDSNGSARIYIRDEDSLQQSPGGLYSATGLGMGFYTSGGPFRFFDGSGETLHIEGGNVGIGTTSPYAKLSVVGPVVAESFNATSTAATSTFAGGLDVGNGAIRYDFSSGVTSIENLAIGAMEFDADSGIVSWTDMPVTAASSAGTVNSYSAQIDGTPILTISSEADGSGGLTSTGVGIGTSSPQAALHVTSASDNNFVLEGATGKLWGLDVVASDNRLRIGETGVGERLTILPGGNIGIGTSSPLATLAIATTTGRNLALTDPSAGTGQKNWLLSSLGGSFYLGNATDALATSSVAALAINNSGNAGIGIAPDANSKLAVGGHILIQNGSDMRWGSGSASINGSGFGHGGDDLEFITNFQTRLYVNGIGSIGIGTTSPASKLDVWGDLRVGTSSIPTLFAQSSTGNVGIGTGTPASKLTIEGGGISNGGGFDGADPLSIITSDEFGASIRLASTDTGGKEWGLVSWGTAFGGVGDFGIVDYDNEYSPFTIAGATGNVGIGTTTPASKLTIAGTVSLNELSTGSGAGALCLSADGEVLYNAGAGCFTSSQRFKHDIASSTLGLDAVMAMRPVTYFYNDDIGIKGEQFGFIAEDIMKIDERLVVMESTSTPLTVKYDQLGAVFVKAIQDIASIAGVFKDNLIAWLGNSENGIADLFAKNIRAENVYADTVNAKTLCLDGLCVTKDQLQQLLNGQTAAAAATSNSSGSATLDDTEPATTTPETASTTPPVEDMPDETPAEDEAATSTEEAAPEAEQPAPEPTVEPPEEPQPAPETPEQPAPEPPAAENS